jgi:hypothetical protein
LAQKIRIPDVAIFLIVGIAIGPHALGLVDIKADSALNQLILLFGASYILFDGGASLRFNVLKQVWITIVFIATVGVIITAAVTGLAAHFILGEPLLVALLLGATLASTDPATLVPIFRQVKIRDRVAQTVMSESAFNDAMAAIVTFGVLAVARAGRFRVDEPILAGRGCRRYRTDAAGAPGDRVPVRVAGSARALEFRRDAVHVLDTRDRRHPGRAGRPAARHEGARRADDRVHYLHCYFDDDPDPGADHRMAGAPARTYAGELIATLPWPRAEAIAAAGRRRE